MINWMALKDVGWQFNVYVKELQALSLGPCSKNRILELEKYLVPVLWYLFGTAKIYDSERS